MSKPLKLPEELQKEAGKYYLGIKVALSEIELFKQLLDLAEKEYARNAISLGRIMQKAFPERPVAENLQVGMGGITVDFPLEPPETE